MKNISYIFKIFLFFGLFTISCNKDFLETKPLSELSSADVWRDQGLSKAFINGIYYNFTFGFNKYMKAVFVDEGHRRDNSDVRNFNNCLITSDAIRGWQRQPTWNDVYNSVRDCNLFIDGVANATFDGKDALVGEVKFLRAWNYYLLTSFYGGVPIIDKAYTLTDKFNVPRNTYKDCIQFIVDDLDEAASLLPVIQAEDGRATKGAALTLKSRVLLYAASDLHNTTVFPGYSNPELIGYTDVSSSARAARWQAAKDAAKAVIDMNVYSLVNAIPAPTDSVADKYTTIFLSKHTVEDIWVRYFTSGTIANDNNLGVMNGPNGWGGQSNNAPLGNLVDDFEMRDGTKFDWNNPAHAALPYTYREPRFYANIFYEGAKFKPRPAVTASLDPLGIVHSGYFETWNVATQSIVVIPGVDSRNGPYQPINSSQTLYFCRKMLDPSFVIVEGGVGQDVPWRYMRYAEVLLNYAEACIELNQDAEARTYINMIRTRAGLPGLTESGIALRERYRNERRIELMYEDHRFFDVRRWVIGPKAYNINALKANVTYKLLPDHTTSTVPTIFHETLEKHSWINKAYFFPILRTEMNKNDQLIQNPDY